MIKLMKILSESNEPEREVVAFHNSLNDPLNANVTTDLMIITPTEFCSLFGTGRYVSSHILLKVVETIVRISLSQHLLRVQQ